MHFKPQSSVQCMQKYTDANLKSDVIKLGLNGSLNYALLIRTKEKLAARS